MPLPISTNTTCDIYRVGNAPPSDPDLAAVSCRLEGHYHRGLEAGEATGELDLKFTHVVAVSEEIEILDGYNRAMPDSAKGDTIYVPDQDGTPFRVVYVEIRFLGTPAEHKRVYLRRLQPAWPTTEL